MNSGGSGSRYSTPAMFLLAFIVGINRRKTYGIGGGAVIAPFCVAVFHLPVYTVAGAALMGTFLNIDCGCRSLQQSCLASRGFHIARLAAGFLFRSGGICRNVFSVQGFQKFIAAEIYLN